ncbi:substrate-binding domain-containing protein [Streptococcus orisratti]|nr:sugar ABC transporter substrate-binding protein [Streptococcus orisratti]
MFKKEKTKSLIALILGLLLVFGIYVNYRNLVLSPNQRKIGVTYMTMNNAFYKVVNAEVEKVVDSKGDILYTRDPALSVEKQCQQVETFISKKVDAIIINPVDSTSKQIVSVLKKAHKKGIKIIVVDSQLEDDSVADTTVVSDNYNAGVLDAQQMMSTVSQADILLLEHSETLSAVDRIKGFMDTISGHDAYRIVARRESFGQTERAMPVVEGVIERETYFDVVMALNDQSALGALAAIKEKNLSRKIYIYGVDGSPDMKNFLNTTNDVEATVAQSPIAMGEKAITTTYQLLEGKKVDKLITIPVSLITKENISDYDVTGWQ